MEGPEDQIVRIDVTHKDGMAFPECSVCGPIPPVKLVGGLEPRGVAFAHLNSAHDIYHMQEDG